MNNLINFIIVNCLQHVLQSYACYGLNNIYHVNVYINQIFLNRECERVQKLFILQLVPDLDPEP